MFVDIVLDANVLIRELYLIIAMYSDRIIYISSECSVVPMFIELGKILPEIFYWLI